MILRWSDLLLNMTQKALTTGDLNISDIPYLKEMAWWNKIFDIFKDQSLLIFVSIAYKFTAKFKHHTLSLGYISQE